MEQRSKSQKDQFLRTTADQLFCVERLKQWNQHRSLKKYLCSTAERLSCIKQPLLWNQHGNLKKSRYLRSTADKLLCVGELFFIFTISTFCRQLVYP